MKNKLKILVATCAVVVAASTTAFGQEPCTEEGSILSVVAAKKGKFETVTFTVNTKDPTYEVRNARPPFQEYGDDKILRIRGPYYKSVFFQGINWMCTIREDFKTSTSNISKPRSIEQFEGHVEYIVGYRRRGSYVGTTKSVWNNKAVIVVKFRR